MQQGTVKFYNTAKAYGFITQESGDDLFFHISGITKVEGEDGYPKASFLPREGDEVSFSVEGTDRGDKAVNVELVTPASQMEGEDME